MRKQSVRQMEVAFARRNKITDFCVLSYGVNKPVIGLDLNEKGIFITQQCETGRSIGVHVSCRNDDEIIGGWCGLGWTLFGKKFVQKLIAEWKEIHSDFTLYDGLVYESNFIKFKS
jgi:hypothetical protein